MRTTRLLSLFFLATLMVLASAMMPQGKATDYLGVPGPQRFDGNDYLLSWTSHPSAGYYKHEYVPKGDNVEHFNSMMMIEAVVGDIDVKDAVDAQIKLLDTRKKTDPVARYELTENGDKSEYILDFIASESQGGKVAIVEWNAYRYAKFTDPAGHKGVLLLAISKRGYNDGIKEFFSKLTESKSKWINEIAAYKLPAVNIKK